MPAEISYGDIPVLAVYSYPEYLSPKSQCFFYTTWIVVLY